MNTIAIVLGVIVVIIPVWVSALLVGAKNRGVVACVLSVLANAGVTLSLQLFLTNIFVCSLLGLPLIGFINSKIFETSFLKGMLIAILSGVLLAIVVISFK
jgi:hypothetical protein